MDLDSPRYAYELTTKTVCYPRDTEYRDQPAQIPTDIQVLAFPGHHLTCGIKQLQWIQPGVIPSWPYHGYYFFPAAQPHTELPRCDLATREKLDHNGQPYHSREGSTKRECAQSSQP